MSGHGGEGNSSLPETGRDIRDEPPPILKTWPRVYAFVLAYLAALIILSRIFTLHYRPGQ